MDPRLTVQLIHLILVLPVICYSLESNGESSLCPPLVEQKNVQLSCRGKDLSVRCDRAQTPGTIAKYKCKRNHIPFDELDRSGQNELQCELNGEWSGLKRYDGFRCKEDCGRVTTNARPLVIHGVPTNRTQWPWHAAIFRKTRDVWSYICGGSIIRNQIIVSAAHCFAVDHSRVKNPEEFRIILGSVSSKFAENLNQDGVQIHWVQRIHISATYDPLQTYQGDIAVIQLKENIEFNENVIPVCLPNDYRTDVEAVKPGNRGKVAGYGITEEGTLSQTLRSIDLEIRTNAECFKSLQRVVSESQFCGGNKDGVVWETVCNGDSGGGLVVSSAVHERHYIHGIVSSGDPNTDKGVCKNYAVFTRVYPYVFWIRDVIEEISGEIATDLQQNPAYPYALRGTETQSAVFNGLPREWINRVTSLKISHTEFNAETLMNALEAGKPIEKIEFNSITLLNGTYFKRLALLPVLSNFTFDLLPPEAVFNHLDQTRTFPIPITEKYLRSLIFFDKETESEGEWRVESLNNLAADIELTVHIFRLLRLRVASGELILQQTPLADKIIQSSIQNLRFILQSLALHRIDLDKVQLGTISTLTELILDQVRLPQRTSPNLTPIFVNLTELKTLVLNLVPEDAKVGLDLQHLSRDIVHLSLTNLKLEGSAKKLRPFKSLRTFCCFDCKFENELVQLFPNLSSVVMKMRPGASVPLFSSPFLRSITIEVPQDGGAVRSQLSNLYRLETSSDSRYVTLERDSPNANWKARIPNSRERHRSEYSCNAQSRFWTSEEDFLALRRLKTFEKAGLNSKKYKYVGPVRPYSLEQFNGIPESIQSGLQTIHLTSVDVTPLVLTNSIAYCQNLRSLTLTNVVLDISSHKYPLIKDRNLELRLEEIQFPKFTFRYVLEYLDNKLEAAVIPNQVIGRFATFNSSNVLHHIIQNVNCVRLTKHEVVVYWLDTILEEGKGFQAFLLSVISKLPEGHVLKDMAPPLRRIYETNKEGVLPNSLKFNGLHVIRQELIDEFFDDIYIRALGPIGVINYVARKFEKFATLERATSLSLSTHKNPLNFPVILAIAADVNVHRIE